MNARELADRHSFAEDETPHDVAYDALTTDEQHAARFDRPRSAVPLRLAVVSDPHVAGDEHGTWKMLHRTRDRFRATLAEVEALGVDALLLSGDLTKDGEEENLDWIEAALDDVDIPVLAVPGNHDVKEFPVSAFAERFTDDGFPVHLRLDGLDVIGLNSAMSPAETEGDDPELDVVSEDQLDWLEATLPGTTDPIVVSHHNLPGLVEHIGSDGWAPHPPVGNADALVDVLAAHDVPLHLSGHVHLLSLTRPRGVRGLISPSLASFPQSYLLLEIDLTGTTVRCRTTATRADVEESYDEGRAHSARSTLISDLNAEQLRALPLVDERNGPSRGIDPIRPDSVEASRDDGHTD
ncbi:metallophosphoesterase [Halorarum halophilum]|uniref:Metallophosphoesterase n=1 Tax=Halorarum halophilum TaxID=2743090 RepID=A0A7D5KNE5_9EURY|nr:metallophosphoesterase [Halobaculum halophilum]QLG29235.1 metallophosphoesterase [Halobaculum halophilum]